MIVVSKPVIFLGNLPFLLEHGLRHLGDNFSFESLRAYSQEMLHNYDYQQPHVLVMCYNHQLTEKGLLQKLLEQGVKVILLVEPYQIELIRTMLDLSVPGILTTHCSRQEIESALYMVAEGKRFYCNTVMENMMNPSGTIEKASKLTNRELDVLRLIAKGKSTSAIAEALSLSTHTINSHRKNILRKLNLKSPTELIIYAIEHGLDR